MLSGGADTFTGGRVRMSRCLPRETTDSTIQSTNDKVAWAGTRKSLTLKALPPRAASNRRAVRKTVSPSGIAKTTNPASKDALALKYQVT